MLRKLAVLAVCCVALGGIGLVTARTAGKAPNWKAPATPAGAVANATPAHDMMAMNESAPAQSAGQNSGAQGAAPGSSTPPDLPAYHATAPKDPLPATLDPMLFPDPMNQNIYALAAKEKKILYQQPCYCHCDREVGHKSLLDCYVDRHASVCATCKMEAVFAYQEMQKGKTAAQIRQEIIDGKWHSVDLSSYAVAGAVKPDTK
jgi:Protein of unknown function with PCYCGC motif